MARHWVKMHTSLPRDANFSRLSRDANHTFLMLPLLAGDCDEDGHLRYRSGPLTDREIASLTKIPLRAQQLALEELEERGFVAVMDSCYSLLSWDKYNPPLSGNERLAKHRESQKRKRNANVTNSARTTETNPARTELEEEKEVDSALTSGGAPNGSTVKARVIEKYDDEFYASPIREFVTKRLFELDPDERRAIARLFAYRFANCRSAQVVETRASHFAKPLVAICSADEFSQLTVRDYFAMTKRAWMKTRTPEQVTKNLNPAPVNDPWLFKTEAVRA